MSEEKTVEWFLAQAAALEREKQATFRSELRDLVRKWYPSREPQWSSIPMWWHLYPEAVEAVLLDMVCPIVCRGYLDGDENWHQLCLDKVQAMKEAE